MASWSFAAEMSREVHYPSCQEILNIPEEYLGAGNALPIVPGLVHGPAAGAATPTAQTRPLSKKRLRSR